jgi:hypothetical protein
LALEDGAACAGQIQLIVFAPFVIQVKFSKFTLNQIELLYDTQILINYEVNH